MGFLLWAIYAYLFIAVSIYVIGNIHDLYQWKVNGSVDSKFPITRWSTQQVILFVSFGWGYLVSLLIWNAYKYHRGDDGY